MRIRFIVSFLLCVLVLVETSAQDRSLGESDTRVQSCIYTSPSVRQDSVIQQTTSLVDSAGVEHLGAETKSRKGGFWHGIGKGLYAIVKAFNAMDTTYIEPQLYNYTLMLQQTTTYEMYSLRSKNGQEIIFAPDFGVKLGPYFGWRWLFLGYTVDLRALHHKENQTAKKEFDLSLYSSTIGIDLFWRETGNNYRIKSITLNDDDSWHTLHSLPFSGLSASIKGFNLYYIFNHKRFSYPAAFSQSTCQRKSCGSALLGIGYTHQSLKLDYENLEDVLAGRLGEQDFELDDGLKFNRVKYVDYSISGGYAYNWVFAHNWLLAASLSVALGYKSSSGDVGRTGQFSLRDFNFKNFNLDGVGRFGVVWNNTRWYAGASAIVHAYNYHKSQFSATNMFGSLNIYFGWNFARRDHGKR